MSKYLRTAILSFLGLFVFVISGDVNAGLVKECEEIKVKTTIEHTSGGQPNGKILFEFEDPEKADAYKILLLGVGWDKPLVKGTKEGFKNLEPGYYDIYLIYTKDCSKQLNLQVK